MTRGSDFAPSHENGTGGGDKSLTYPPMPTNSPSPMPTNSLTPTCPSTPKPIWPSDTEIALFPGTNKILLTLQSVLMREIFQDSFEHLRVSLLFIHAFPDPCLTHSMTSEALTAATRSRMPRSFNIQMRLQVDEEYMSKMCRLVSPFDIASTSNIIWLMFLATRSHSNLPRGGQGTMC
jgi:hypothetical protein